jgi:hypothetical protein
MAGGFCGLSGQTGVAFTGQLPTRGCDGKYIKYNGRTGESVLPDLDSVFELFVRLHPARCPATPRDRSRWGPWGRFQVQQQGAAAVHSGRPGSWIRRAGFVGSMRGARSEEIKRRMLRDGAGGELAVPPLPCHHCHASREEREELESDRTEQGLPRI